MPRFYFDLHDGIEVIDDVGHDLAGIEAAKSEAMRIASAFAANPKMVGGDGGVIVVTVRDAPNSVVRTIRLAFTISEP